MGLVTKTYTFSSGAVIVAAEHNTNFDTLYTAVNGNIDNDNIKSSAGIVASKLVLTSPGNIGTTSPANGRFVNLTSANLSVTTHTILATCSVTNLGVSSNTNLDTTVTMLTGTNKTFGIATLSGVALTVTNVSTTAITADACVFLARHTLAGTPNAFYVSNIYTTTSFDVTCAAGDTGKFMWWIVKAR